MKQYIEERVLKVADYIIENKATIRETARFFGVSKSTVHKDITERIFELNPKKTSEVEKVILFNKNQRHLRCGEATKKKWQSMK
ncbi:sporulation transcriptional regulator SpoIIID [Clostridium perfringens]|uniref:sporulation transcriptional regulator SpoIIID n=1 Tax=Clostridium perfringens TaxID=1502 RepID=UPI000D711A93|nr:sporulation transcriptional regulator SpoIIID [Clostridium perfringens]EGT4140463.1 sporulation transcriptional regulator SpoIIID [Clostridium perfringens]KAB8119273.1 sporulation transcriptional regulator SpoIIID [Clostridium perfringens]MBO3303516.1 sporulation transcriptional regulator SpoIIID [Clostridium perfringens]MBO3307006.1 sporulation transcriptional regulator SpoIIID [Clostridium perfringens]MBO3310250.1 sporulation transcriptional regulator SpoIIID [Clostridium perfringens]